MSARTPPWPWGPDENAGRKRNDEPQGASPEGNRVMSAKTFNCPACGGRMDETIEGDLLGFEEALGGQIIRIQFNPPRIVPATQLQAGDKVVLIKKRKE